MSRILAVARLLSQGLLHAPSKIPSVPTFIAQRFWRTENCLNRKADSISDQDTQNSQNAKRHAEDCVPFSVRLVLRFTHARCSHLSVSEQRERQVTNKPGGSFGSSDFSPYWGCFGISTLQMLPVQLTLVLPGVTIVLPVAVGQVLPEPLLPSLLVCCCFLQHQFLA